MSRFRNDYSGDWPEISAAVRSDAGDRCIRCGHPSGDTMRRATAWDDRARTLDAATVKTLVPCDERCAHALNSVTVFPVVSDVTLSAHAEQVAEGVCLAVMLQPEEAERYDVRDGELLGECVLVLSAPPATKAVATPSLPALLAPVRAVVADFAAVPVRALGAAKVVGEPLQPTRVSAESLRRLAQTHFPALPAGLAGVNHAPRLAVLRTMPALRHPCGWPAEVLAALRAWLGDGHSEIYNTTVGKLRVLTTHHLDGDKANNRWWNLLALCQVCHLQIQAKVVPERAWMLEHSGWFKPYVAGFYAHYYGGIDITRDEADANTAKYLAMGQPWLYAETRA